MDHRGRRNRRRNHSRTELQTQSLHCSKTWSSVSGLYTFIIMSSLLAIIYLMLEHHCRTCTSKCDLSNITKNIEEISKNLSLMKDSYNDLEKKMVTFSQDLPKIEGQIDVLEALANMMDSELGWGSKALNMPRVKVALNRQPYEKGFNFTAQHLKNGPEPIIANQA